MIAQGIWVPYDRLVGPMVSFRGTWYRGRVWKGERSAAVGLINLAAQDVGSKNGKA